MAAERGGLRDPGLLVPLALASASHNQPDAATLARSALSFPALAGADRCSALYLVANDHFQRKQDKEVRTVLLELVTLRRHSHDWLVLANCQLMLNNKTAYVEALETVVRISPQNTLVRQRLVEHYRAEGDPERARWHERRLVP